MTGPGLLSRAGFRLMALMLARTRPAVATEERLRAAGLAEGQVVLDYGCGPGWFAVAAGAVVGSAGRVVALDRQPSAVRMTADRARRVGLDNVATVLSDRESGLPDHSVDVVLLFDTIQVLDDRRAVLAEIDRVLRPGGHLSVWVEHGDPAAAIPLVTGSSRFVLRERRDDVLIFVRDVS